MGFGYSGQILMKLLSLFESPEVQNYLKKFSVKDIKEPILPMAAYSWIDKLQRCWVHLLCEVDHFIDALDLAMLMSMRTFISSTGNLQGQKQSILFL